jgi:hypothetical protein
VGGAGRCGGTLRFAFGSYTAPGSPAPARAVVAEISAVRRAPYQCMVHRNDRCPASAVRWAPYLCMAYRSDPGPASAARWVPLFVWLDGWGGSGLGLAGDMMWA